MASWWVGKDREAFNKALKDETTRVMQSGVTTSTRAIVAAPSVSTDLAVLETSVEPIVPVAAVATEPEPTPALYKKQSRWRKENIAKGLCSRCGAPRTTYADRCDSCYDKRLACVQRLNGYTQWHPGSRGHAPKRATKILALAAAYRSAIEGSDEAINHPALGRAGVVMLVGFLFRQRMDWIVPWTKFHERECLAVRQRLLACGIWSKDGTIAGEWMEMMAGKRIPKREVFRYELAFWLDAMVGLGEINRETRDGEFYYSAKPESSELDD